MKLLQSYLVSTKDSPLEPNLDTWDNFAAVHRDYHVVTHKSYES